MRRESFSVMIECKSGHCDVYGSKSAVILEYCFEWA